MATSKAKSAKKSAAKKTTSSKSAKVKGATSKAKTTVKTTSAKTAKKPKVVAKEVIAEPVEEKPKIMSEKAHPVKEFFARKGDPTENILTIFKDTKIIGALIGEIIGTGLPDTVNSIISRVTDICWILRAGTKSTATGTISEAAALQRLAGSRSAASGIILIPQRDTCTPVGPKSAESGTTWILPVL